MQGVRSLVAIPILGANGDEALLDAVGPAIMLAAEAVVIPRRVIAHVGVPFFAVPATEAQNLVADGGQFPSHNRSKRSPAVADGALGAGAQWEIQAIRYQPTS